MLIDRYIKKQELIQLTEERNVTMIIFAILFVVTVVFALMVSYSVNYLCPFGISAVMFGMVWYSLIKQFNRIERKRIELKL